jgi:adenylate cyclase
MPYLIVHPGKAIAHRFVLPAGRVVLGRALDNAICVNDKSLSRRHAELVSDEERITIGDLGSKNGTYVNGARLRRPVALHDGDHVRCGEVVFEYRVERKHTARPLQPETVCDPAGELTAFRELPLAVVTSRFQEAGGESERLQRRLEILLHVSQLLSQPSKIEHLQDRIVELSAEILPIDRAVLLRTAPGGQPKPVATRFTSRADAGQRPYSSRIVAYVLEQKVAALFTDAQADERLARSDSVIAHAIRCSMCAPLLVDGRAVGVLYVDNLLAAHTFTVEDLSLLTAFANQAALALANSQLQQRLGEAAVLKNTFARFFPPATVKRLMETKAPELQATEMQVTTLFSDISGFTEMSSVMHPTDVVKLLNEYFPRMASIVFELDGTLEKYIGDALMAVWGAPFSHPDDADRAVRAAVMMQKALMMLNHERTTTGQRPLGVHIGLHSGRVAFANIGSEEYIQYATIGDATNIAARVCNVAEEHEILITEKTKSLLVACEWPLEALEPVLVKGKKKPLHLHRVLWR